MEMKTAERYSEESGERRFLKSEGRFMPAVIAPVPFPRATHAERC